MATLYPFFIIGQAMKYSCAKGAPRGAFCFCNACRYWFLASQPCCGGRNRTGAKAKAGLLN